MPVSEPTKRVLAFRSGNLCAFPDCVQVLVVDATAESAALPIGEAAHIAGERLGAARYDASMSERQRSAAHNLIYLCPTHHTVVDGQPDSFPTAWLLDVKGTHEATVFAATRAAKVEAMSAVGFAELDVIVRALATSPPFANPSLVLTVPEEKISRNGLGPKTRSKILIGIAKAREVENFFNTPEGGEEARLSRCGCRGG